MRQNADFGRLSRHVGHRGVGRHVEEVGKKMSGSAGASGLDAVLVSAWLLKFGGASKILRTVITRLVEYLSNGYPHWASYRAMMYCREIGLDKCPGVRLIGIRNIFRRLCCKIVLLLTKDEATKACGIDQL